MFRRKPEIIRVSELIPFGENIFDVRSLDTLKKNFKRIYETDSAYFARNNDGIFRFKKPNFKPVIRKVEAVVYDPSESMVFLSRETLEAIAITYGSEILETDHQLLILMSGLLFIAEKSEEEEET